MSPKYRLDLLVRDLGRHVAGDDDDGVVRAVVRAEPLLDVVERRRVEVLHRPDRRVVVGVALGVGRVVDELAGHPVRVVLALPLLVLNDPALLVELGLVHGAKQVAHPVGLHEQDGVERLGRDVLEVVRPVRVGRPVEVGGPDALQHLEVVVVEVLGPVEHEVFEQVGEPALPVGLVLRPDVVPHVDGDDGRLVVLVDDEREPVVEHERLVGDVGEAGERVVLGARERGEEDERARRAVARRMGQGGVGVAYGEDTCRAAPPESPSREPRADPKGGAGRGGALRGAEWRGAGRPARAGLATSRTPRRRRPPPRT